MSNRIVNVTITKQTRAITQAGFGLALIIAQNEPVETWTERSRLYSSPESVATDFGSDSDEYKAVQSLFGQSPRPKQVRIARRDSAVATVKKIVFSGDLIADNIVNGAVNGKALTATTFSVDNATTLAAIATKIAAITGVASAVAGPNDITVTATAEYSLDLTSFAVTEGVSQAEVSYTTTTAGRSIVDDFDAVKQEKDDFYFVALVTENAGAIYSMSRRIASEDKMGIFLTSAAGAKATTTTDIGALLNAALFENAAIGYHSDRSKFLDMGIIGKFAPYAPGSISMGLKEITGVPTDTLTDTEVTNLLGKKINIYTEMYGRGVLEKGWMANGERMDIIRDTHYIKARVTEAVFRVLTIVPKVPYTNVGREMIETAIYRTLYAAYRAGIINSDFRVEVPALTDISDNDKADRYLPDVKFFATVQGAIESVDIFGTISV